jgi:hypothetical protein
MDIGMLWFDDSARPLRDKVERAVEYYAQKYGRTPTLCLVNPAGLDEAEGTLAGVEVRGARSVMKHHLWIGVDEQPKAERPSRRLASSASLLRKPGPAALADRTPRTREPASRAA